MVGYLIEVVGDLLLHPNDCLSEAPGFVAPRIWSYFERLEKTGKVDCCKYGAVLEGMIMNKTKMCGLKKKKVKNGPPLL